MFTLWHLDNFMAVIIAIVAILYFIGILIHFAVLKLIELFGVAKRYTTLKLKSSKELK